ncbi:MAG: 4Fe-4S dicluster domain-containing protein [Candidatus Hydrogenedentes bacterium]|nr:4Fe-4S dicluster domain-containing protein [Candidatus Hydrogenedentota bacterium]
MYILEREYLAALATLLLGRGYELIGPKLAGGVITYAPLAGIEEMARKIRDAQGPGHYRSSPGEEDVWFSYVPGAASLKPWFNPPKCLVCRMRGSADEFLNETPPVTAPKRAFIGVRACEVAALRMQDKIFLEGPYADPEYRARREGALILAVNCSHPAETCFCASMQTGPKATTGFDLALTEISAKGKPAFLIEKGSDAGGELLGELPVRMATAKDKEAAILVSERAAQQITREINPERAARGLAAGLEHPHWATLESRCMNCANCTLVCPTCFCSTMEDSTSLSGDTAERWRLWDSCFVSEFTYIHGGSIRKSGASRYRQWLGHKFSHWHKQFGASGCVGCGRCIAWCPAGIDITRELAVFEASAPATARETVR